MIQLMKRNTGDRDIFVSRQGSNLYGEPLGISAQNK